MLRRILIAEDEPYIVESLTFLLSREGHQVTAVGDGAAVLPAIASIKPDLLILDIMLPASNGFENRTGSLSASCCGAGHSDWASGCEMFATDGFAPSELVTT